MFCMVSFAGMQQELPTFSTFNAGRQLMFSTMLMCHGYFGDIIRYAEDHRNLGVMRYPVASKIYAFQV